MPRFYRRVLLRAHALARLEVGLGLASVIVD